MAERIFIPDFDPFQLPALEKLEKITNDYAESIFKENKEKILKYTDPGHLMRLMIARNYEIENSFEMWKKWVNWRLEYKADEINETEIANELMSGKAFWHKQNLDNNPCLVVKVRYHDPEQSSIESMVKFGIFLIEKGIKLAETANSQKICVIWDREGFSRKNFDKRFIELSKKFTTMLQDNYAERLAVIYVIKPNWFFRMIYRVVSTFLNEKTKKKIKLIYETNQLLDYFEPNCLLKEHGGTSEFVHNYNEIEQNILNKESNNEIEY